MVNHGLNMDAPPAKREREEVGISLGTVVDAAGDLGLAALFLVSWLAPGDALALPLQVLLLTMLLEFIVVHSTGFMGMAALAPGSSSRRAQIILGLGLLYTLFVGGFAYGFRTWSPLIAFWGLTLNRSLGVLLTSPPAGREELQMRKGWAAVTMTYLLAVGVTTVFPVPSFGITRAVVSAADLPSSGLWVSEPYRVAAAGVLHFGLSGLSALWGHRWISDRSIPRRSETRRSR